MSENTASLSTIPNGLPTLAANDAVFSPETNQVVTGIVADAEARTAFSHAAKGVHGIFALVGDVVAHLGIHVGANPAEAARLIRLRNAANDDASGVIQPAEAKKAA